MTGRRLYIITATMMLSLFIASIEVTIVATAMPTIVSQLGGLQIYAWVFSAYMLATTTMVPIFGKLSDIYGRRSIYLIAMAIFMVGSFLCAQATSMEQLVVFRLIQGLGAGGIQPLAFTIIGDIFTFERRAKMQGLFSGVWGFSSIVGPVIGGFLVDQVSWQWIFLLNIPFGLVAATLMILAWRDVSPRSPGRVDFVGTIFLGSSVVTLLLALSQLNEGGLNSSMFWGLFVTAIVLLSALLWVERRAENPILPLPLFRDRLFAIAIGHGFLAGFALFGSTSFITLFVESVLGTSATAAGATLTPQLLAWVTGSIIGSRLLLRFNYRSLALTGMSLLIIGMFAMVWVTVNTPQWVLLVNVGVMGLGMGLSVPSFLIAVQSSVPRHSLGTATATVQFSRSIGGTVGVSVMGVVLAMQLANGLRAAGLDPNVVSIDMLLESTANAANAATIAAVRGALTQAIVSVFWVALVVSVGGWVVTALAPRARIGAKQEQPSPEETVVESITPAE